MHRTSGGDGGGCGSGNGNIGGNSLELSNAQLLWNQYQQAIAAVFMSNTTSTNNNINLTSNNIVSSNNIISIEQLHNYLLGRHQLVQQQQQQQQQQLQQQQTHLSNFSHQLNPNFSIDLSLNNNHHHNNNTTTNNNNNNIINDAHLLSKPKAPSSSHGGGKFNNANYALKANGCRFKPVRPQQHSHQPILAHKHKTTPMSAYNSNVGAAINTSIKGNAILSPNSSSNAYWSLLESLFAMNDKPEDEAIELIAQRINSTSGDVADWFQTRREAERSILYNSLSSNASNNNCVSPFGSLLDGELNMPPTTDSPISLAATTYKPQPPAVPSSTLLAKLNAITSRQNSQNMATMLDQKMIDLLEALYVINDNPEPAAIEMIAKRINSTAEAIGDWFDEKRMKTNPHAGPRSPPAKKREGGRVVTFSEYQRSLLEAIFDENNYLHPQEYEELSNLIQVPSRNIKIWFKNRRSKQRLSGRITVP